jgi:hypothetical protein
MSSQALYVVLANMKIDHRLQQKLHSRKFSAERKICKTRLADTNFRRKNILKLKIFNFYSNNDFFGKFSVPAWEIFLKWKWKWALAYTYLQPGK